MTIRKASPPLPLLHAIGHHVRNTCKFYTNGKTTEFQNRCSSNHRTLLARARTHVCAHVHPCLAARMLCTIVPVAATARWTGSIAKVRSSSRQQPVAAAAAGSCRQQAAAAAAAAAAAGRQRQQAPGSRQRQRRSAGSSRQQTAGQQAAAGSEAASSTHPQLHDSSLAQHASAPLPGQQLPGWVGEAAAAAAELGRPWMVKDPLFAAV